MGLKNVVFETGCKLVVDAITHSISATAEFVSMISKCRDYINVKLSWRVNYKEAPVELLNPAGGIR